MARSDSIDRLERSLRKLCGVNQPVIVRPRDRGRAQPDADAWREIAEDECLLVEALCVADRLQSKASWHERSLGLSRCWHLLTRRTARDQIDRYYRNTNIDTHRIWSNASILIAAAIAGGEIYRAHAAHLAGTRQPAESLPSGETPSNRVELLASADRWLEQAAMIARERDLRAKALLRERTSQEALADAEAVAGQAEASVIAAHLAVRDWLRGDDPSWRRVVHTVDLPVLARTIDSVVSARLRFSLLDGGPTFLIEHPPSLRPLDHAWLDALMKAWSVAKVQGGIYWSVETGAKAGGTPHARREEPVLTSRSTDNGVIEAASRTITLSDDRLLGDLHAASATAGFRLTERHEHYARSSLIIAGVQSNEVLTDPLSWQDLDAQVEEAVKSWKEGSPAGRIAVAAGTKTSRVNMLRAVDPDLRLLNKASQAVDFGFSALPDRALRRYASEPNARSAPVIIWIDGEMESDIRDGGRRLASLRQPADLYAMVLIDSLDVDPFYIDRYPVTVGRYRSYGPLPTLPRDHSNPFRSSTAAMTWLSAEDMRAFARWTGRSLPSLDQWQALISATPSPATWGWGDPVWQLHHGFLDIETPLPVTGQDAPEQHRRSVVRTAGHEVNDLQELLVQEGGFFACGHYAEDAAGEAPPRPINNRTLPQQAVGFRCIATPDQVARASESGRRLYVPGEHIGQALEL